MSDFAGQMKEYMDKAAPEKKIIVTEVIAAKFFVKMISQDPAATKALDMLCDGFGLTRDEARVFEAIDWAFEGMPGFMDIAEAMGAPDLTKREPRK